MRFDRAAVDVVDLRVSGVLGRMPAPVRPRLRPANNARVVAVVLGCGVEVPKKGQAVVGTLACTLLAR